MWLAGNAANQLKANLWLQDKDETEQLHQDLGF